MRITLVGSRYFGAVVLERLRRDAVDVAQVVVPAADDRLAAAADAAAIPVHVLADPKRVPAESIAEGTGLIVAAHTHARVSNEALARSALGGVGYHPSLLPRHRGIAAVEWTILEGDPIAGGSVYHLADGWDAGAIAAQDWCFVARGETARELWERALAPMGLDLLAQVVRHAAEHGVLPAHSQDERFATRAPMIRRSVKITEGQAPTTSLVVTVIGPDRPGIVSLLSQRAQGQGANWAASHMASLAGQFAGIVHFEVPPENADALTTALRGLESTGLRVMIAKSEGTPVPAGQRLVTLELFGLDRPGIIRDLSGLLVPRGVSIEDLHTEIVNDAGQTGHRFKLRAALLVPAAVRQDELRRALEPMTSEGHIDLALGDDRGAASPGRA